MVRFHFFGYLIVVLSILLSFGCGLKNKSQSKNSIPNSSSSSASNTPPTELEKEPTPPLNEEKNEITEDNSEIITHLSTVNYCDSLNQNFLVGEKKKSIYYQDDRKEFCELEKVQRTDARSVAMLVFENQLKYVTTIKGEKIYKLEQSTLDDFIFTNWKTHLCPDVRYRSSQNPGFCTAFLVDKGVLLTAGHCILSEETYGKTKIVFSIPEDEKVYQGTTKGSANWYVGESQIFDVANVKKDMTGDSGLDYAYMITERSTGSRKHLPLDNSAIKSEKIGKKISKKNRSKPNDFFVLGHPMGLSLKNAPGYLLSSNDYHYIMAVDTFGGNSGSPVFNNDSKKVIGILVAGQQDFYEDYARGCVDNSIYSDEELYSGENILRMDRVLNSIGR